MQEEQGVTVSPARLWTIGEAVCKHGAKAAKELFLANMPGCVGESTEDDWTSNMSLPPWPDEWPTQEEIDAERKASPITGVGRQYRTDIDVSLFVGADPEAVLLAAMQPWFEEWAHDPEATWEPKGYYLRCPPTLVFHHNWDPRTPPVIRLTARIMVLAKNPDYAPKEAVTP